MLHECYFMKFIFQKKSYIIFPFPFNRGTGAILKDQLLYVQIVHYS